MKYINHTFSIYQLGGRRAGGDLGAVIVVSTVKKLAQEYTEKVPKPKT